MQTLVQRIDALLESRPLLKHPFYERWSAGELTLESLSGYAKEYYQLVKEVPRCVAAVAEVADEKHQRALISNQEEEQSHVPLWEAFARGLGQNMDAFCSYEGLEKTRAVVKRFHSLCSSFGLGASTMYAFEKPLPAISQEKLSGLARFYGIETQETIEYFRVHAVVDIEHAKQWAKLLDKEPKEDADRLFEQAKASLDCQHQLLDVCMEAYA